MNAPDRHIDWVDANQRMLVAEFARLKRLVAGEDATLAQTELDAARAALVQPAAIDQLADIFGLTGFERDILLLAAAAELDGTLAVACARRLGAAARQGPTFGLALEILDGAHWSALSPTGPLRRWRLVLADEGDLLSAARLRVDERVLHFVAGVDGPDPQLAPHLRAVRETRSMAPSHCAVCDRIEVQLTSQSSSRMPLVVLHGDDSHGAEDIASVCARRLGRRLQVMSAAALGASIRDGATLTTLFERDARMASTALLIDLGEADPGPEMLAFIERVGGPVFVWSADAPGLRRDSVQHRVALPLGSEQRGLWGEALAGRVDPDPHELDEVAAHFRLAAHVIEQVAQRVDAEAAPNPAHPVGARLWNACRGATPDGLSRLAQRVDARARLCDLVLPAGSRWLLAQVVTHMRQRALVHDDWGFAAQDGRGLGVAVLFSGESGTGKTFAAEALAQELRLDLFRIDLAGVVSKYIGETEKNLRRVFDVAEGSGAVLLFDEADALFGKRSEVKDSHDRYANIEVSYLLQRMESYQGLTILTSNHKAALDSAFTRRLRFVVPFSFPEPAEREALWRSVLPAQAPTHALDFHALGRLAVTGGTIRNIALKAAFMAAETGTPISMAHLLSAARLEAANREKTLSDAEIRGWQ